MTPSTTHVARAAEVAVAGTSPRSARHGTRLRLGGLLLALAGVVVLALLGIGVGARSVPLTELVPALLGRGGEGTAYVIQDMRVPRTGAALLVGGSLGVAGALIQALTRNPLADPGILGVNAGAAFFVALAVGVFGITSTLGYVWFAFAGALVVTVAVYLIGSAGRRDADPVQLTLAGLALGAVLSGLVTAMMLLDPGPSPRCAPGTRAASPGAARRCWRRWCRSCCSAWCSRWSRPPP